MAKTYQEHDRDIKHKGTATVKEEGEETNVVNLVHGNLGDLPGESNHTIEDSTDGGEVVDGDKRVHLEIGRVEQTLNHGETESLEHDTSELKQDTDKDEVKLANRGNDDTNNDGRNVEELFQVGLGDTKSPTGKQDSDGGCSLEHLNEGNGQVEVSQVAANQTQTEEDTDRDNCAQIDAASHLDRFASIEDVGEPGQNLRNDSRKSQMVGR